LLGLGVSAISAIGNSLSQNTKELPNYYKAIDANAHAHEKGLKLTQDDIIRGEVIRELMCNMSINKNKINEKYSIDFDQYFAEDLPLLKPFINDGLLSNTQNNIRVDQKARLLIRNICMSFDANLKQKLNQQRFSRVI
jgi:oxygen-independent coproporphyrinogen-3 oxidase